MGPNVEDDQSHVYTHSGGGPIIPCAFMFDCVSSIRSVRQDLRLTCSFPKHEAISIFRFKPGKLRKKKISQTGCVIYFEMKLVDCQI